MTRHKIRNIIIVVFGCSVFLTLLQAQTKLILPESVGKVFARNCTEAGCHAGAYPAMNLSLEPLRLLGNAIAKPSMINPNRLIIDPNDPEKSYLLAKIRGDQGISGKRMPLEATPLSFTDLKLVTDWVMSLKGTNQSLPESTMGSGQAGFEAKPPFWGLSLINLPTTETGEPGRFYFRISHRYASSLREGLKSLFGLDGPSVVWLGFGYGLTDRLSLSLGRTNLAKELEAGVRWKFLDQDEMPFEASLHAGIAWTTEEIAGRKIADSRHFKYNVQISLVRRFTERLSLMAVPSLSTQTDHWTNNPENTFAVGFGGRFMVLNDLSFIGEWIPVLAGYETVSNGWGFGLEKKIGGHVFQFFICNSLGLTPDLYLPGGDLRLGNGDIRLGFNIFRTF